MNVTRHQLHVFAAAAETGSITKAAERLHLTQPTVSVQIKQLGEQLGLPVIEIIGKRLFVTEAGQAVLEHYRNLIESEELLQSKIAALRGLQQGRLKISFVSTAKYLIPAVLGRFCQDYPDIDISMHVQNRGQVIDRLKANKDDLYVMTRPPLELPVHAEPFMPNPLVVIAPRSHPLSRKTRVELRDLEEARLILREKGSGTRMAVDEHIARHGLTLNVKFELGSNESIWQAVAGGLGLSIISRHALMSHAPDSPVCELAVDSFPIPATWYLVHPQGKILSPLARRFLDYLRSLAENENVAA